MKYRIHSWCLLFFSAVTVLPSRAETPSQWPARTVKIVTAFAAGSASDMVARLLAGELQTEMGQPFVVENKPGASGIIAAEMVAKSPADGYTLMLTTNTINSANPHLFSKLPYDALKDFTPIARICNFVFVLVVSADSPVKSVSELITWSSANPNKMNYAYGNSTGQVAGAAINHMLGLNAQAIRYKSTPQALTALVGGEVNYLFVDLASSQALLKAGRLRGLAISSAGKSNLVPDLMPLASMPNLNGFDLVSWLGLVGPAGMPADITARLSSSINRLLMKKAVSDRLTAMGADIFPGTSIELGVYMNMQYIVWRDKIKLAGIKPE